MKYVVGSELPDLTLEWYDRSGALIDFSSGWTFQVKVAPVGSTTASFTKTTGITGAATAPNVIIGWVAADLGALTAGSYEVQVKATRNSDSKDRFNPDPIRIAVREAIS